MTSLLAALGLLTRIPVPSVGYVPTRRMLLWFVPCGLVIGGLSGAVYLAVAGLHLHWLAAVCGVVALLALSGGLHMDGLMDTADALGSNAPRDRALEIMRDSRVGAFGAMALVCTLLLKAAALVGLPRDQGFLALLTAPAAARLVQIAVCLRGRYARTEPGMGAAFLAEARPIHVAIGVVWLVPVALSASTAVAAAIGAIAALLVAWRIGRRLGGHTGDTLGAVSELTEVFMLVAYAALTACRG